MKIIENIDVDVDKCLREIENLLRDNISYIFKNKYGEEWIKKLGVTEDRVNKWEERKTEEIKRLNGKNLDDRLLYYADFYDLHTIIINNWDIFKKVFEDKKEIVYQLKLLESFRNPNAHNRDLLNHQKHLLLGIVGEIKLNIMRYQGDENKEDTYFPYIESVQLNADNYKTTAIYLKKPLRRGDILEITVFSCIPPNQEVFYAIYGHGMELKWQKENKFMVELGVEDLFGKNSFMIIMKSDQEFHRINNSPIRDGAVLFEYTILPS